MKRLLIVLAACLLVNVPSFGWGREAHEAIAKIADNHLKPSVKKTIEKYLGGRSIVYYAKWMDDYRHTEEYGFTTVWHIANVDDNLKYIPDTKVGDAISGINGAAEVIRDRKNQTDSAVVVNLKYILHLVGDMHCPSHIYYKGRNQTYKVDFGGGYVQPRQIVKIHTVWDQCAIQATRIWGLTDWAWELDRLPKKQVKAVTAGTPVDWLEESAVRCLRQFELSEPDQHIAQDFVNEAMPLIETQVLYAGLRMAALLNDLF